MFWNVCINYCNLGWFYPPVVSVLFVYHERFFEHPLLIYWSHSWLLLVNERPNSIMLTSCFKIFSKKWIWMIFFMLMEDDVSLPCGSSSLLLWTLSVVVFFLIGKVIGVDNKTSESLLSAAVNSFWWSLKVRYLNFIKAQTWSQMVKGLPTFSKLPTWTKHNFFLLGASMM